MLAQQEAAGTDHLVVKPRVDPALEAKRMANTRAGGAYIPPHRLRAMMAEQAQQDEASDEYQRLTWDALRKSINGLVNKVNTANIKLIVPEVRPCSLYAVDLRAAHETDSVLSVARSSSART